MRKVNPLFHYERVEGKGWGVSQTYDASQIYSHFCILSGILVLETICTVFYFLVYTCTVYFVYESICVFCLLLRICFVFLCTFVPTFVFSRSFWGKTAYGAHRSWTAAERWRGYGAGIIDADIYCFEEVILWNIRDTWFSYLLICDFKIIFFTYLPTLDIDIIDLHTYHEPLWMWKHAQLSFLRSVFVGAWYESTSDSSAPPTVFGGFCWSMR